MFNPIGVISVPIVILGVAGITFLKNPVPVHINILGDKSPAVATVPLGDMPPDGALVMISSVPIDISHTAVSAPSSTERKASWFSHSCLAPSRTHVINQNITVQAIPAY